MSLRCSPVYKTKTKMALQEVAWQAVGYPERGQPFQRPPNLLIRTWFHDEDANTSRRPPSQEREPSLAQKEAHESSPSHLVVGSFPHS